MTTEQKSKIVNAAALAASRVVPRGFGLIVIIAPTETDIYDGGELAATVPKAETIELLRQTADRLERNLAKTQ